jgi:hypothetical protein
MVKKRIIGGNTQICKSYNTYVRVKHCYKNIFKYFNRYIYNLCLTKNKNDILELHFTNFVIRLEKILGEGNFGIAFLCRIIINNDSYEFVLKIQQNAQHIANELHIIKQLSKYVENNINPHFLLFYKDFICNKPLQIKENIFNSYTMFAMERADGNLYQLFQEIQNESQYRNIITQIILSIFSFHQITKMSHNDIQSGNFLYQSISDSSQKGKYVQYIFNNKIYYLKCMNYVIHITDYGIAKHFNTYNDKDKILDDYWNVFNFEITKWGKFFQDIDIILNKYQSLLSNTNNNLDMFTYERMIINELIANKVLTFENDISHNQILNIKPYQLSFL